MCQSSTSASLPRKIQKFAQALRPHLLLTLAFLVREIVVKGLGTLPAAFPHLLADFTDAAADLVNLLSELFKILAQEIKFHLSLPTI
jgi:hypothetical protein